MCESSLTSAETGLDNARLMTRQAPKLRVASFRYCGSLVTLHLCPLLPSYLVTILENVKPIRAQRGTE